MITMAAALRASAERLVEGTASIQQEASGTEIVMVVAEMIRRQQIRDAPRGHEPNVQVYESPSKLKHISPTYLNLCSEHKKTDAVPYFGRLLFLPLPSNLKNTKILSKIATLLNDQLTSHQKSFQAHRTWGRRDK